MKKNALLVQANGNNARLREFFKQPKYDIFFKNKKIIEHIYINAQKLADTDLYIAVRDDICFNNNLNFKILKCSPTYCRTDSLKQIIHFFEEYENLIIHDCDVIIDANVLRELKGNSLAVTTYKHDGLKYGFVDLDTRFNFINGNEKTYEANYITIGAYCVVPTKFKEYIKDIKSESLLDYYNMYKEDVKVVFSNEHINLGDIDSYITNLWK